MQVSGHIIVASPSSIPPPFLFSSFCVFICPIMRNFRRSEATTKAQKKGRGKEIIEMGAGNIFFCSLPKRKEDDDGAPFSQNRQTFT